MLTLFENIIKISIRHRFLIMLMVCVMAIIGVYNFQKLPIDAVPDITNVQIQVNTEAYGYSPMEVEQRITYQVENAMAGIPYLDYTRSVSRYGLSQVTVIFKDSTDIYFARKLISERLQEIKEKLPPGIDPIMGPISTGLGEIFMYTVEAKPGAIKKDGKPYTSMDLRTVQDWIIRPQLRNIKGVADINTIGGYTKQFQIAPIPKKMLEYKLAFDDIINALQENNANVGAGYIEHSGRQYLLRVPGQVENIANIEDIVVKNYNGTSVYIKDVADVLFGEELRTGAVTKDGEERVLGTVFMLMGENSRTVSQAVSEQMQKINTTLPAGVLAKPVYNRTILVDSTIQTVAKNLVEGALLVIVILFLLLGNIKAALLTAMVIPLSMLFTITGMVSNKISGNLLSLGAIDFGIIVDGSVIIVENCIRRLSEEQHKLGRMLTRKERLEVTFDAAKEVRKATMFGELIIMIVYLPILTLTGVEGKMFQPMALTVIIALIGAMLLSVTFVPAAIAIFLSGKLSEKENIFIGFSKKIYSSVLKKSLENKLFVVTASLIIFLLTALLTTRMGSEFLPTLDEGDITVHGLRIPGTSLSQAIEMQKVMENKIKEIPEVETVFAKIGTAEIATDPMPPSVADVYVMIKPRNEWKNPSMTKAELVHKIEEKVENLPGNKYEFTQPMQMRFNELIAGVRSDIGIKIFGDDMDVLLETGNKVSKAVEKITGAEDVKVEQVTGLPVLTVNLNRKAMARYGLNVSDVQDVVEIAIGGKKSGELFEGDRRFDIVVRLPEKIRSDITNLEEIPIALPHNDAAGENTPGYIKLGAVANIEVLTGPNQISRENGKRLIIVTANVRGRDLGSFVDEAQQTIKENVEIPAGYWVTWGGQFEQLISATKTLEIVVPVALLLIFLLLYSTFNSIKDAILVFTGVPLALTGGIFALWLRDIPLSISAAVGFIALSGIAVLNGLVMISFIKKLYEDGKPINEAIFEGAVARLRPVLMTALVASLGFIPMAISTAIGAEVQRPLATVVIGGIISSTLLTLIVLPVLYQIFYKDKQKQSEEYSEVLVGKE